MLDGPPTPARHGPAGDPGAEVMLPPGSVLTLYTDGLVEDRDHDLDNGIARLCRGLDRLESFNQSIPDALVRTLLPDGHDDDVAMIAHVEQANPDDSLTFASPMRIVPSSGCAIRCAPCSARGASSLGGDDVVLLTSELTTNAIVYGSPPMDSVRDAADHFVLEVFDWAAYVRGGCAQPRRRARPRPATRRDARRAVGHPADSARQGRLVRHPQGPCRGYRRPDRGRILSLRSPFAGHDWQRDVLLRFRA